MAVLQNGSKCSHTTCMLRFFTVSRLALKTNLIFEIGSNILNGVYKRPLPGFLTSQSGAGTRHLSPKT